MGSNKVTHDSDEGIRSCIAKLEGDEADIKAELELWREHLNKSIALKEEKEGHLQDTQLEFVKKFLPHTVSTLMKRKYSTSDDAEAVQAVLLRCLDLIVLVIDNNLPEAFETLALIFDYRAKFYKRYGHAMEEVLEEEGPQEATPEWRNRIGFADWIDAVYVDAYSNQRHWKRAQIVEEMGTTSFKISFENMMEHYDVIVSRESPDIAPEGTKTQIEEVWRKKLEPGTLIDCLDPTKKWYNATILAKRNFNGVPEVCVGYRVYSPNGEKADENGNFHGWSSKYDEWIPNRSARIAQFNTRATGANSFVLEEPVADDSDPTDCWAVKRSSAKYGSQYVIDALNHFGRIDGYEGLLGYLRRRNGSRAGDLSLKCIQLIVRAIQQPVNLYSRPFADIFFLQFRDLVFDAILSLDEAELRDLDKPILDGITSGLERMLRRIYSKLEVGKMTENFQLQMAAKCLKSPFMKRKLQGLTIVMNSVSAVLLYNRERFLYFCRPLRHLDTDSACSMRPECGIGLITKVNDKEAVWLTAEALLQWIRDTKLLEELFGSHPQLISRGADLIRFLSQHGDLRKEDIETIWSSTLGQTEDKVSAVYKLIRDVSYSLSEEHLTYLIKRIGELPAEHFEQQTVELILDLARLFDKGVQAAYVGLDLYWRIVDSDKGYSEAVIKAASEAMVNLVRGQTLLQERIPLIHRCLSNLEKGRNVAQNLLMMRNLIETFPPTLRHLSPTTQGEVVENLCAQFNMIEVILGELLLYRITAKEASRSPAKRGGRPPTPNYSKTSQDLSHPVSNIGVLGRIPYVDQLTIRLSMLKFLIVKSSRRFTVEQIQRLWQAFYEEAKLSEERSVILRWLEDLALSQTQGSSIFDADVPEEFFTKRLANPSLNLKEINAYYFHCLRAFFLLVNEQKGNLTSVATTRDQRRTDYIMSEKSPPSTLSPDLHLLRLPREHIGLDSIWRVAFATVDVEVVNEAINLLNKLYQSLPAELQSQLGEVRSQYIARCMDEIEQSLESGEYQSIDRAISLLETLLDQSEVKGNAGLKAHSARIRGGRRTIKIVNDIDRIRAPRKFELEVNGNTTIWELRMRLGQRVNVASHIVGIGRHNGKKVEDVHNTKTLIELNIKNGETLHVFPVPEPETPKAALLTAEGELVAQARKIFTEWFQRFSVDGYMDREGAARFIDSCLHDNCRPDDSRVTNFFTQYDDDKDGRMTLENFLELYRFSSKNNEVVVRNNLRAHGYGQDLMKLQVDSEKPDTKAQAALPRYIISTNARYFHVLVHLVDLCHPKIPERVWSLLMRLPTNPDVQTNLWKLDLVRSPDADWNLLLDSTSIFKLFYSLQIVESWVETWDTDETAKETEERAHWRKMFLLSGGFHHLYNILMSRTGGLSGPIVGSANSTPASSPSAGTVAGANKETNIAIGITLPASAASPSGPGLTPVQMLKEKCLALVLKIVGFFLLGALSVQHPDLIETVNLVRQNSQSTEPLVGPQPNSPSKMSTVATDRGKDIPDSDKEKAEALPKESTCPSALNQGAITDRGIVEDNPSLATVEGIASQAAGPGSRDFRLLVRQLSGKMLNVIIDQVDFHALQERLIEIARDASSAAVVSNGQGLFLGPVDREQPDASAELADLVENALSLWVGCVLDKNELLMDFYRLKSLPNSLDKMIFCRQDARIRREIAHALHQVCEKVTQELDPHPKEFFFWLLLEMLPEAKDTRKRAYEQYFDLLSKLLEDKLQRQYSQKLHPESCDGKPHVQPSDPDSSAMSRFSESGKAKALDDESLLFSLVQRLRAHSTLSSATSSATDEVQIGIMKLLVTLVTKRPALADKAGPLLVDELFHRCLFSKVDAAFPRAGASSQAFPRCTSEVSRHMAFTLLQTLCKQSIQNFRKALFFCLEPLKEQLEMPTSWAYSPSSAEKSKTGFVGLKNLGNTCYMNSVLQQCFMIPAFREAVLQAVPKANAEENGDDSLVAQLQTMFGFLRLSERQFYDCSSFCLTYKDWDGNPVDVSQQQDAQQFLLRLFDRLEDFAKRNGQLDFVKALVGGTIANQMQFGNEKREREEEYYCVSLKVEESKDVYSSLEKFVAPTSITGYNWDDHHKGIDIKQRNCFSRLGEYLILHLNRFAINYNDFTTEKVNSRFEFPLILDMEPYTKEGLATREAVAVTDDGSLGLEEREEGGDGTQGGNFTYELVGVVVHSGTANSGHYYSIIRKPEASALDNLEAIGDRPSEPSTATSHESMWLKFDDQLVTPFNIKDLEAECFGGPGRQRERDRNLSWDFDAHHLEDNIRNAYILFYKRRQPFPSLKKNPGPGYGSSVEQQSNSPSLGRRMSAVPAILVSAAISRFRKSLGKKEEDSDIMKPVQSMVLMDNSKFLFERHIYHTHFYKFVYEIFRALGANLDSFERSQESASSSLSTSFTMEELARAIALGLSYTLEIFSHSTNHEPYLERLLLLLGELIERRPPIAFSILDDFMSDPRLLGDLLFQCPDAVVRKALAILISRLVRLVLENGGLISDKAGKKSRVAQFVHYYASFLSSKVDGLLGGANKIVQYLEVFRELARMGEGPCLILLSEGMVAVIVDFILGEKSPLQQGGAKGSKRSTKGLAPSAFRPRLDCLVDCLAELVIYCDVSLEKGKPSAPTKLPLTMGVEDLGYDGSSTSLLSDEDLLCLHCKEFYETCIAHEFSPDSLHKIVEHCLWNNGSFSRMIVDRAVQGAASLLYSETQAYCLLLRRVLEVKDSHYEERIDYALYEANERGLLELLYANRYKEERPVVASVQNFLDLILTNESVAERVKRTCSLSAHDRFFTDWIFYLLQRLRGQGYSYNSRIWATNELLGELGRKLEAVETILYGEGTVLPPAVRSKNMTSSCQPEAEDNLQIVRHREAPEGVVVQVVERLDSGEAGNAPSVDFEVINKQPVALYFTVKIVASLEDPPNFKVPEEQINTTVPAQTTKILYRAEKLDPRLPWGLCPSQYTYQWRYELQGYTAYTEEPSTSVPVYPAGAFDLDDRASTEGQNDYEGHDEEDGPPPLLSSGAVDEEPTLSCPACTFFNAPSNPECEMCGTSLK